MQGDAECNQTVCYNTADALQTQMRTAGGKHTAAFETEASIDMGRPRAHTPKATG